MSCIKPHPHPQDCPFASLEMTLSGDPRDWSENRRDAWIYGIVIGWDADSLEELREQHGWSLDAVIRLTRLRAEFESIHRAAHPKGGE